MLSSLYFKQFLSKHFSTLPKLPSSFPYLHPSYQTVPLQPLLATAHGQPLQNMPMSSESGSEARQEGIYNFTSEKGLNNMAEQAINIGQPGLGIDSLKQTLEEDEERHGEPARDRDTGKVIENDEELGQEEAKADDKKKQQEEEDDDDDDDSGGGLLIPLIEWVGGLIPRLAKDPTKG